TRLLRCCPRRVHHARELRNTFRCRKEKLKEEKQKKLYCSIFPLISYNEDNLLKDKRNI
ncbi:hypothetical protein S83_042973, partial [Arachis hypogaea]